ncbi:CU044_2847 family protein [Actinokineospora cianjurensis]|uniref:CU044_2847 family protein n=1 Tax=Actinokineospora cianjurensis TaxID=585224 RepID=UPI000EAE64BA|nr:CU044_2847 family protein [Actinokineospora cianjurensis]
MSEFVEYRLDGGGTVSIEVEEQPGMARAGRAATVLREATETLDQALANVRAAASAALGQFRAMANSPDEIEIKFGVKLDVQAGAVIARTGLQGQFEVKLKWIRSEAEDEVPDPEG